MLELLVKFKPFALEMAVGGLVGALGLLQLAYGVPPLFSDLEMLRKFAASLITIGGTMLASGVFRFVFSIRLDRSEHQILHKLDDIGRTFNKTLEEAGQVFASTLGRLQPAGVSGRPQEHLLRFRFLYWRTERQDGTPIWLRFSELAWRKQVLPFLEAKADIAHPDYAEHHDYVLAMVELRGCIAVVATRFMPNGLPHSEMAGVYLFAVPIDPGRQMGGFLRHVSMRGRQCLSPCLVSVEALDGADLDELWSWAEGGGRVSRNFAPRPEPALPA